LKDLLMQVAPQARIAENTSRLSSKASANILSKVLSSAAQNTPQEFAASSSADGRAGNVPHYDYGSQPNYGTQPKPEEDEESAFMERWSGLFSKGSPLVEGNLEDPFSDLKKRAKVVWKKNRDRAGHRTRYQERKKQKEMEEREKQGDGDYDDDNGEAEGGASVVWDASWTEWQPEGSPAGSTQWQPERPPAGILHQ